MVNTNMVSTDVTNDMPTQLHITQPAEPSLSTEQSGRQTPTQENETGSLPCIGQSLENRGLSKETREILMSSWRDSTKKQYWTYQKKWVSFCDKRHINIFETNVNNVLTFLTELFHNGLGYSSLNTARCALSSFLQLDDSSNIGSHPLIRRFFKGVFVLRPTLPRYNVTWDVNIILNFLNSQVSSLYHFYNYLRN